MRSNLPPLVRTAMTLTLLAAVSVMTAPGAQADQPIRGVIYPAPLFIPAGEGCAFDVSLDPGPDAQARTAEFADGRSVRNAHADVTFTNDETGATFEHRARFLATSRYDPLTNEFVITVDGTVFIQFGPGDQGPYGVVGSDGAMYRFTGGVEYRADADTFAYTYFASTGKVEDICAALS